MYLHTAIKNLIDYHGEDFICDSNLVTDLVELKALDLNPALKIL